MEAASYAIPLAEHFNSEIHLVHVLPPFDDFWSEDVSGGMMADRREQAQRQLDIFLNAALRHLRVKRTLLDGDPTLRIVECGRRESSDLIMMSTHGYGPFRRALLGSVTAKVLHDTNCPVWTGAHLAEGPPVEWGVLGHVACAVNFTPHSEKALDWAARLAGEFNAALSLIHVEPRLDSPGEAYYSEEYRRRTVEAANDNIAQLQRKLGNKRRRFSGSGRDRWSSMRGSRTGPCRFACDRTRFDRGGTAIGASLRHYPEIAVSRCQRLTYYRFQMHGPTLGG